MHENLPELRSYYPQAIEALSSAREQIISEFEPVEGSKIHDYDGLNSGEKRTLIRASDLGVAEVQDRNNRDSDYKNIKAMMWIPEQSVIPALAFSIKRHQHSFEETRQTRKLTDQNDEFWLRVVADVRDEAGVMVAHRHTQESTKTQYKADSRKERNLTSSQRSAEYIYDVQDIRSFFAEALAKIALK